MVIDAAPIQKSGQRPHVRSAKPVPTLAEHALASIGLHGAAQVGGFDLACKSKDFIEFV